MATGVLNARLELTCSTANLGDSAAALLWQVTRVQQLARTAAGEAEAGRLVREV